MKNILIVLAVLAVCFTRRTQAVNCFQCNSLTDRNCANDNINVKSIIRMVDCDLQPKPNLVDQFIPVTKCNKVIFKVANGEIVSRGCQFEIFGQKEDVCSVPHNREIVSCQICKGDLCNSDFHDGNLFHDMLGIADFFNVPVSPNLSEKQPRKGSGATQIIAMSLPVLATLVALRFVF